MPRDPFAEPVPVQGKGKGGGKKAKDVQQEKADTSRGNPVTVVLDDSRVHLLALQDRHSEQLGWGLPKQLGRVLVAGVFSGTRACGWDVTHARFGRMIFRMQA